MGSPRLEKVNSLLMQHRSASRIRWMSRGSMAWEMSRPPRSRRSFITYHSSSRLMSPAKASTVSVSSPAAGAPEDSLSGSEDEESAPRLPQPQAHRASSRASSGTQTDFSLYFITSSLTVLDFLRTSYQNLLHKTRRLR